MLFRNQESSLQLDIVNYEFPPDGGDPTSDDPNWLVLRAAWVREDGTVVKDSNSCLLTHELQGLAAGLKVLKAGIRDHYASDFQEDFYFSVAAQAAGEGRFDMAVSFYLPNTMDGDDTAEIACTMDESQMSELIGELDRLCEKFPDRT